jgi:uncharacterized protein (TIGR00255 family)
MLLSMTGYGKTKRRWDGANLEIEVQSVNGKFSNVSVNLPRSLTFLEYNIKDLVKSYQVRGSIYITVTLDEGSQTMAVDAALFDAYYGFLKRLKKKYRLPGEITMDHLLALYRQEGSKRKMPSGNAWNVVEEVMVETLAQWQKSRQREGEKTKQHLLRELRQLKNLVATIQRNEPARLKRKREALAKKQQAIAAAKGEPLTDGAQVQKYEIAEEIERFKSHLDLFQSTLNSKESEGKKMNFIVQELNREAQTMSAKSSDIQLARLTIAVKEGIERIREQVQNVE